MASIYKCPSCEEKIKYGCNYCQHCGVKLEWEDDDSAVEDLSELSEDELVVAYGLNKYIDSSNAGPAKYGGGVVGYASLLLFEGVHNFLYTECSEVELCHSENRLYGIAPNKNRDEINVDLKDILVDYLIIQSFGS